MQEGNDGSYELTLKKTKYGPVCSTSNKKTEYNTLQIHRPNVAMRIIYATAAITTAAVINAGLITYEDKRFVVDNKKSIGPKEKVIKSLNQEFDDL